MRVILVPQTGHSPWAAREPFSSVTSVAFGGSPSADELQSCLSHWDAMTSRHRRFTFERQDVPRELVREAVEENTGEKFRFHEPLEVSADFVADLQPADTSVETRGLAEVCLVLFNSNEFAYLY